MKLLTLTSLFLLTLNVDLRGAERSSLRAAAIDARPRAAVGEFDRVIPLILNGGGSKTSFVLTNLDSKRVYFKLFFVASDGSPLSLSVTGVGNVGGIIGGMAIVKAQPASGDGFESTVPIVPAYETRFTLPFDQRNGLRSAIVVLNSSTKASPLKIVVRDSSGSVLAEDSATLNSFQRVAGLLSEIYPQTADQAGVIVVSTTAIGLSGLGLRVDQNGRFTTVQTLSTNKDPDDPKPPAPVPSGNLSGAGTSCSSIEGVVLFADDGQYLGKITSNTSDPDSIGNEYGRYGSSYSALSIFNSYGRYGGTYSAMSPFNPYTTTPPVLFLNGRAVAFLTSNPSKTPGVVPTAIYPCIGRK